MFKVLSILPQDIVDVTSQLKSIGPEMYSIEPDFDITTQTTGRTIQMTCRISSPEIVPEKVFWFLTHLDRYYLQLSAGHQYFRIQNGAELQLGSTIDNKEHAGGQSVHHLYSVIAFDQNRYLELVSKASRVTGWLGCVLYDICVETRISFQISVQSDQTVIFQSDLCLRFDQLSTYYMAKLLGTTRIWSTHFEEEMRAGMLVLASPEFATAYDASCIGSAT